MGGRFNEVSGEDGFAVGAAASVVHHGAAVLSFGASAVGPTAADPVSEGATCASVQNHSINVCVEGMGGFFVNGAPVLTQLFGNVTQCQSQVAAQVSFSVPMRLHCMMVVVCLRLSRQIPHVAVLSS